MIKNEVIQRIFLFSFLLLALVPACTASIPEETEPVEPTETPLPTPEPIIEFVVTFDGNGCMSEGPTEVLPGEHAFKFIDQSDAQGELWLLYMDEGKTTQDQLDGQSEPGEWYPKPAWVHYGSKVSGESEVTDEGKVEISVWKMNEIREYTIMCYVGSPQKLWFVAPIFVVESLAD